MILITIIKNRKDIEPLSIKKNSLWNLFGSLVHSLTQWGIIISIAKFGSPEMVGVFTLALAITAPIVLFLRFNLRSVVASDSRNEYSFTEYYSLRLASTIIFVILVLFISLIYSSEWEVFLVIIIFGLSRAVESVSDILYGLLQKHERLDITAKSRVFKGLISLIIFISIMYFSNNLVLATSAYFLSWLFILIFYDYPQALKFESFRYKYNITIFKEIFFLSIPLGFAQLITSLSQNIPRYFLEYFQDPVILGFFGSIIYIISAGNNFVLALSSAIIPRLSQYFFSKEIKKYIKLFFSYMLLVILFGLGIIIVVKHFGSIILTVLYTQEYGKYGTEFYYFTIMGLIMYVNIVLETGLTSIRNFKIQPYINIVNLITVVSIAYLLIPQYSLFGVLISLVIGQIVQLIIRVIALIISFKKHKINYSFKLKSVEMEVEK